MLVNDHTLIYTVCALVYVSVCACVCVCVVHLFLSLSLSLYVCVCVCFGLRTEFIHQVILRSYDMTCDRTAIYHC